MNKNNQDGFVAIIVITIILTLIAVAFVYQRINHQKVDKIAPTMLKYKN